MNNGNGLSDHEVIQRTINLVEKFKISYAEINVTLIWVKLNEPNPLLRNRVVDVKNSISSVISRASNLLEWARGCENLEYLPSDDNDFQVAYDLAGDIEDQNREILIRMRKLQTDCQQVKENALIADNMKIVRESIKNLVDIYQDTYDINKRVGV